MKVVAQVRNIHIEWMEKALNVWIEDNTQKGMPLGGPLMREKAKLLHDHLSGMGGASTSAAGTSGTSSLFSASRGWFHRFKARYNLHNDKLVEECASVDHDVAEEFPAELVNLIEEKGYLLEQVLNADATGLFFISQRSSHSVRAKQLTSR